MADWQPMKTAPRDGRSVLLYIPGEGAVIGANNFELFGGGNSDVWWINGWPSNAPTHWQPLPDPPK